MIVSDFADTADEALAAAKRPLRSPQIDPEPSVVFPESGRSRDRE
jgi:hypothetical protein